MIPVRVANDMPQRGSKAVMENLKNIAKIGPELPSSL